MRKRVGSLLLALVMCLGLMAVPAGATGEVGKHSVIGTGTNYTAVIDPKGVLWMWGENGSGQLGVGTAWYSSVPVKVLEDVTEVSCGRTHTAAIRKDGTLWMWGWNGYGQLGSIAAEGSPVPVKVMDDVAAVSCGTNHTAAIKTDGTLWMWGFNLFGQLGNGTTEDSSVPVKVMDDAAAVSCGWDYTAAIKTDGTLWMWGSNDYGQLGNGAQKDSPTPVKVMDDVAAVSCAAVHTAALRTDGTLWMWGSNESGQLGNGGEGNVKSVFGGTYQTVPVKVLDNVATVSCAFDYTAAVKTDGTLWTWGRGGYGQLGDGAQTDSNTPVKVLDGAAAVSCWNDHTVAVKTDGTVWAWGSNLNNYLFQESKSSSRCQTYPLQVDGLTAAVDKPAKPTEPAEPEKPSVPTIVSTGLNPEATGTAYASTQTVKVDGSAKEFQYYALKDANGGTTNYVKLRDLADVLDGTAAQFNVTWAEATGVGVETKTAYSTRTGKEGKTPYTGDRSYQKGDDTTLIDGMAVPLQAFVLTDDEGGDYTYYKLRDLGQALGFNVGYDEATDTVFIETNKPYDSSN